MIPDEVSYKVIELYDSCVEILSNHDKWKRTGIKPGVNHGKKQSESIASGQGEYGNTVD